jgi:sugar-specific transcriptional regulator TrmB
MGAMNEEIALLEYLNALGVEKDVAKLYACLVQHGPQTISELSRSSGVERTRIYRLERRLNQSGLFEVEALYKRVKYAAAPLSNLRLLLANKEHELKSLQKSLDLLEKRYTARSASTTSIRVNYYHGAEGVKQMLWNQTRTRTEVLAILQRNMQVSTKAAFFEYWVRTANEHRLRSRGLVSDEFLASQGDWYSRRTNERLALWQARYVPPNLISIGSNMIIYNNVVAFYEWRAPEIYGVEINSPNNAEMQRSLFEIVWQQAEVV